MDAVKYLKTVRRMCNEQRKSHIDCEYCPFRIGTTGCQARWIGDSDLTIEQRVNTIEKWAKEHPEKTILQDFLEKYPKATPFKEGYSTICPERLGYNVSCAYGDCNDCWNKPLED